MSTNSNVHSYQEQLAKTLRANNASLSEAVIQAFSCIPRHPFVDHYYIHENGGSRVWTRQERDESDTWYKHIYSDCALVTHVDEYGRTLSSSSQPSIMGSMLQALEIQPGMRILEIGTGSGYNAALLAHLVGDPRLVTTVDIDADAVARARCVVPQVVGDGITIAQVDGSNGYEAHAPYDRIMITASTPTLPHAWFEQLQPGGILVGILQPKFAMLGGLLKAQKCGEKLQGSLVQTASFMELRSAVYYKRRIQIDFHASLFASFSFDIHVFQPNLLRENPAFAFLLYYDLPDLYVFQKDKALFFYQEASPQGYVVFQQEPHLQAELRGNSTIACSLWNRLVRAYGFWDRMGQPTIPQYAFEMDNQHQALSLHTPSGTMWPFGIWQNRL